MIFGGAQSMHKACTKHAYACAAHALLSASPAQAESVIFKCVFDWSCDINRSCQDAMLDVRFRTDVETTSAERLGGDPTVALEVILGDRALTFLERPISGGAATTTVMIDNGDAVRSENLVTGRLLTPMQYLGSCMTLPGGD